MVDIKYTNTKKNTNMKNPLFRLKIQCTKLLHDGKFLCPD